MRRYEYQSDFARRYYGQGKEEGHKAGMEEGREEGRHAGSRDALRVVAVALARSKLSGKRGIRGIDAISAARVLTELVVALGKATSAVEARAALKHALCQ